MLEAKDGEEKKSTHLELQEEFGGDKVDLQFIVEGEDLKFNQVVSHFQDLVLVRFDF